MFYFILVRTEYIAFSFIVLFPKESSKRTSILKALLSKGSVLCFIELKSSGVLLTYLLIHSYFCLSAADLLGLLADWVYIIDKRFLFSKKWVWWLAVAFPMWILTTVLLNQIQELIGMEIKYLNDPVVTKFLAVDSFNGFLAQNYS